MKYLHTRVPNTHSGISYVCTKSHPRDPNVYKRASVSPVLCARINTRTKFHEKFTDEMKLLWTFYFSYFPHTARVYSHTQYKNIYGEYIKCTTVWWYKRVLFMRFQDACLKGIYADSPSGNWWICYRLSRRTNLRIFCIISGNALILRRPHINEQEVSMNDK